MDIRSLHKSALGSRLLKKAMFLRKRAATNAAVNRYDPCELMERANQYVQ